MNLVKQSRYWLLFAILGVLFLISISACGRDDVSSPSSSNPINSIPDDSVIRTTTTTTRTTASLLTSEEANQRVNLAISACVQHITDTSRPSRQLFCTIEALADHCEHDFDKHLAESCKDEVWIAFTR